MDVLIDVKTEYTDFVANAGQVFGNKLPTPLNSNDFLNYMVQSIALMNEQATNNLVNIPNDLLTRADLSFSFTFAPLMTQAEISEDKIPELQVQMEDIKNICEVLFNSRIQSRSRAAVLQIDDAYLQRIQEAQDELLRILKK